MMSEEAMRVIEATAAGAAIYQIVWKPLKTMMLPVVVVVAASVSINKLQSADASLFAQRMQLCLPKAPKLQSPEPEKDNPDREASLAMGSQAS
jgi:hypothetical protein